MSDLEKLLLGEQISESEAKNNESNKKAENKVEQGLKNSSNLSTNSNEEESLKKVEKFIVKKKISIIKNKIRENIKFIFFIFSLTIITLSLSTFYVFNIFEDSKKSKNHFEVEDNLLKGSGNINNEKSADVKSFENKNFTNSTKENKKTKGNYEKVEMRYLTDLKKVEICKGDVSCIVAFAIRERNPSYCLNLDTKKRIECLNLYKEGIEKEKSYFSLVDSFLNGEINEQELKENYGVSLKELLIYTADPRLCNYVEGNFTLCST